MTTDPIREAKQALRRQMRRRRMAMSMQEQTLAGLALARRLESLPQLRDGGLLLGTLPHRGEIDAGPFLRRWIADWGSVALPRLDPMADRLEVRVVNHLDRTAPGYKGILEPDPAFTEQISAQSVTILLVPGLAFDHGGNRLGQGGGHYDRLLRQIDDAAIRIGIAHDCQILSRIPCQEEHDERVDFVVSPIRVLQCRRRRGGLAPG